MKTAEFIPKTHKYWKRPKDDALHPSKIVPNFTLGKALQDKLDETSKFFSQSSRRMGGAGSFTMIDRKTSSRMYNDYLERKKPVKQEQPKFNPHEFIGKPVEQPKIRIVSLPSNYCPDCDSAVRNSAVFPEHQYKTRSGELAKRGSLLNISPVMEPWPAIGLRPGDVIRHIICGKCAHEAEHGNGSGLYAMVQHPLDGTWDQVPVSVIHAAKRAERISKNIETFMRYAHTQRKEKTFYNEEGKDTANA